MTLLKPQPLYHQWDIVRVRVNPTDRDQHYVVIITPNEVIAKRTRVNVLFGTSRHPADKSAMGMVVLDEADGLDRQTIVDCAFFPVINLANITARVGSVTYERRQVILRAIAACLRG